MSVVGHQTPPIFRRGLAPKVRLSVFVLVSLVLLVVDLRFRYLEVVRTGLSVVIYPLQLAAAAPADLARNAARYFATLIELQGENAELRRQQLGTAERLLRFDQLERENASLRALLGMAAQLEVKTVAADILYSAPDPFARKVIIDRGAQHGLSAGLLVVDAEGVMGQISRVHPVQAEVTLLTDHNQAIPVSIARNGERGVLFGAGHDRLEMRFVLAEVDIVEGDELLTSGLDGSFVPGLPVARVLSVDRSSGPFARIVCVPVANVETSVQVMAMERTVYPPPPPPPAAAEE